MQQKYKSFGKFQFYKMFIGIHYPKLKIGKTFEIHKINYYVLKVCIRFF